MLLTDHALDLLLGQAARIIRDSDLVAVSALLVLGGHVEDTVCIEIEGDLNLRHTAGGRRDSVELELAQAVVVLGARALT